MDGQSNLLLIREENGPPDAQVCVSNGERVGVQNHRIPASSLILFLLQFSSWVDAVILVFSLENEGSFQELYQLYSQLSAHRTDIPVIVVGTQGQHHHGVVKII